MSATAVTPSSRKATATPAGTIAAPGTTTVAGYLLTRLAEAGVLSVFGVPGDYNMGLLDAIVARPDLGWVGMATEQGAAYAADSYARQRGLGALVTTFGAGELSAINAIAGAYAESSPVVHIVGTPALSTRGTGLALDHNLPGDGYSQFAQMAAQVTAAVADLRVSAAPRDEIDRVLRTALRTSRPVYLAIPADVAGAPVAAPARPLLATGQEDHTDPATLAAFTREVRRVLNDAASASVLVGHLAIGWAVPAALGASLAAPERRIVLITGDGAFQQTAPEFGTMMAQGVAPVIIVLDNGGYTVERVIHSPSAPYHRIPSWDWSKLPALMARDTIMTAMRAVTGGEFDAALLTADGETGLPVLIQAVLGWADAPPLLRDLARVLAANDGYASN